MPVKIYSAAKTVADGFKFRNKIGVDIINIVIEELVRRRYELPSFLVLREEAKKARAAVSANISNEFPAPWEKSDAEQSIACLKRTDLTKDRFGYP